MTTSEPITWDARIAENLARMTTEERRAFEDVREHIRWKLENIEPWWVEEF